MIPSTPAWALPRTSRLLSISIVALFLAPSLLGSAAADTESMPTDIIEPFGILPPGDLRYEYKDAPPDDNGLPPEDSSVPTLILDIKAYPVTQCDGTSRCNAGDPINELIVSELFWDRYYGRDKTLLIPGLWRFHAVYGYWQDRDLDQRIDWLGDNPANEWTPLPADSLHVFITPGHHPTIYSDTFLHRDDTRLDEEDHWGPDLEMRAYSPGNWTSAPILVTDAMLRDDSWSDDERVTVTAIANGYLSGYEPGYGCPSRLYSDDDMCRIDIDQYDPLDGNVAELYDITTGIAYPIYNDNIATHTDPAWHDTRTITHDAYHYATNAHGSPHTNERDRNDPYASMTTYYYDEPHAWADVELYAYAPTPATAFPPDLGLTIDPSDPMRSDPLMLSIQARTGIWHDTSNDQYIGTGTWEQEKTQDYTSAEFAGTCDVRNTTTTTKNQVPLNVTLQPVDTAGRPTTWGPTGAYILHDERNSFEGLGLPNLGWADDVATDWNGLQWNNWVFEGPIHASLTCDPNNPGQWTSTTKLLLPLGTYGFHILLTQDADQAIPRYDPASGEVVYETVQDIDFVEHGVGMATNHAQTDSDLNGYGDDWERQLGDHIDDLLEWAVDQDDDDLLNINEFRWLTLPIGPIELASGDVLFPNAQDLDEDNWTDGAEVAYWNNDQNDDIAAATTEYVTLALTDPDYAENHDDDNLTTTHDPDSDNDGLLDGDEFTRGTYPEYKDSDCAPGHRCVTPAEAGTTWAAQRCSCRPGTGDGLNDKTELAHWNTISTTAWTTDYDNDGIPNNLLDPDSDGDTLLDGEEVNMWGTKPHATDSDGDGLRDDHEIRINTNPNNPDTDGDGMPDGWEVNNTLNPVVDDSAVDADNDGLTHLREYQENTNPNDADTDGDALTDGAEVLTHLTDPNDWDSDNDGMPDGWEVQYNLQPLTNDAQEDPDQDSFDRDGDSILEQAWNNLHEYLYGKPTDWNDAEQGPWTLGTDPHNPDTDGDTALDGQEAYYGTDPRIATSLDSDDDEDGLTWAEEARLGTNPSDPDTDGDGLCDGGRAPRCTWPGGDGTTHQPGERDYGSTPYDNDTDRDGLSDGFEARHWDSTATGEALDPDNDGLGGLLDNDNDNDDLTDHAELHTHLTNPGLADTDGDRLNDGDEFNHYGTDPLTTHTDEDQLPDGDEILTWNTNPLAEDTDGDGLWDSAEVLTHGTDPHDQDTDADGMPDAWEVQEGTNPTIHDPDQDLDLDGLTNGYEHTIGTKPGNEDSDGDGMPDGYEDRHDLGPATPTGTTDDDADGLTNLEEYALGTNPRASDTDGDYRTDGAEVHTYMTDPHVQDTDGDGLQDGTEIHIWSYVIDGADWWTDYDGDQAAFPNNILDPDSDNDGLDDGTEFRETHTKPHVADTDGDGLTDYEEVVTYGGKYDPNDPDTNNDGFSDKEDLIYGDANADYDDDGLTNGDETTYGTDMTNPDTDCDGAKDGPELTYWGADWNLDGNRLLNPDVDTDGLKDGVELGTVGTPREALYRTHPAKADTDDDGLTDNEEARNNVRVTCGGTTQTQSTSSGFSGPFADPAGFMSIDGLLLGVDPLEGWYVQGAYGVKLYVNTTLPTTAAPEDVVAALLEPQAASTSGPGVGTNGKLTMPHVADTDGDGGLDGAEVNTYRSQPVACDSDGDGLGDGLEMGIAGTTTNVNDPCTHRDSDPTTTTNPLSPDSDGDGLLDGQEDANRNGRVDLTGQEGNPRSSDSDGDGLTDKEEVDKLGRFECVLELDCDEDLVPDGLEVNWHVDSDQDGLKNFVDLDSDNDGVPDGLEGLWLGTGTYAEDSDGDGNANMLDADSDNDGYPDGWEDEGTRGVLEATDLDPFNADMDGDGVLDGFDVLPTSKGAILSINLDELVVLDSVDCCAWTAKVGEFYIKRITITADRDGQIELVDVNLGEYGYGFTHEKYVESDDGKISDFSEELVDIDVPHDVTKMQIEGQDIKLHFWMELWEVDMEAWGEDEQEWEDMMDIGHDCTGNWNNGGKTYHRVISLKQTLYENGLEITDISGAQDKDQACPGWDIDEDDIALTAQLFEIVPYDVVTKLVNKPMMV